jgi:hypothetical protein
MMRPWTIALILIFMLLPTLALGDIYYWMDDQGTQHYTTRLESIPGPYRSKAIPLPLPTSPPVPPEVTPRSSPKGFTKIPFTPGSPVLVSVKINGGEPITLILDTGADRTMVTPSALSRRGISLENALRGVVRGVTGASYVEAVWVNSVEIEEAKVGPLLIIAHDADLRGADGLLGRDFLANFNVTIDSKERILTLAPN